MVLPSQECRFCLSRATAPDPSGTHTNLSPSQCIRRQRFDAGVAAICGLAHSLRRIAILVPLDGALREWQCVAFPFSLSLALSDCRVAM